MQPPYGQESPLSFHFATRSELWARSEADADAGPQTLFCIGIGAAVGAALRLDSVDTSAANGFRTVDFNGSEGNQTR